MRAHTRRKAKLRKLERYINLAADAGAVAMNLRDKPTRLDWMGVGLRVLGLALRVRAEHRDARAGNPWRYFDEDGGLDRTWAEIPDEFRRIVIDNATDVTVEEDWWDGTDDGARVCLAKLGGESVGWIAEGEHVIGGPYLHVARETETYRALGEKVWRKVGGRHCSYGTGGLVLDTCDTAAIVPTAQMRELEARFTRFLDDDVSRSCLMVGPPGTGKTMAIRWLTRRLGVTSVRIDLAVLSRFHGSGSDAQIVASLETVLKLLRPEAMILDDLDRVEVGGPLLGFLELAVRTCRIVMASANCPDRMIGAALRPGRFDEVVRVDRLDPDVLRGLLGDDGDLFERLSTLPAAYVAEFLKRRRVLGRERAIGEIVELEGRRKLVEDATDDGN